MNYCEQTVLYYYDELDLQQREAFEAHLDTCEDCRKELAFLKASCEALQAVSAPQQIVENVLNKTTRRKTGWLGYWKPVLTSFVLIGAGVFMLMLSQTNKLDITEPNLFACASQTYDETYEDMAIDFMVLEELYNEYYF